MVRLYLALRVRLPADRQRCADKTRADRSQHEKGLPHNITCYTPTGGTPTGSTGTPRSRQVGQTRRISRPPLAMAPGFVDCDALTRQIRGGMKAEPDGGDLADYAQSSPSAQQQDMATTDPGILTATCSPLCAVARDTAFHGLYPEAAEKYRSLAQHLDTLWHRSIHQFIAEVMDAASHPGCPQSLRFRTADILSRSSARMRANYNDTEHDNAELCNRLSLLENTARYWTNVLVHQRALQIWEPVLGPEHPIAALLVRNLATMNTNRDAKTMKDFLLGTEGAEISVLGAPTGMYQSHHSPLWTSVNHLHLSDTTPTRQTITNLPAPGHPTRHHLATLQLNRQCALEALHSQTTPPPHFMLIPDSAAAITSETCPEIKLHRIFWLAEQKHKQGDREGALALVGEEHRLFMGLEHASEFVLNHFTARFQALHWTLFRAGEVGGGASWEDCPPSCQDEGLGWNDEVLAP